MNTKESNYLIASFLGFVPSEYEKRAGTELQYHKSWDWLMPVVEKIGKLNFSIDKELENKIDDIFPNDVNQLFTRKEYIYDKVVEFVNWYNKRR